MPSLRYSDEREARTRLGEFEHRELPPFFVLRVLTTLSVHNLNGEDQSWSLGDQLRFSGWSGDDFNCSNQGFVVSDRARLVLRAIGIPDVQIPFDGAAVGGHVAMAPLMWAVSSEQRNIHDEQSGQD